MKAFLGGPKAAAEAASAAGDRPIRFSCQLSEVPIHATIRIDGAEHFLTLNDRQCIELLEELARCLTVRLRRRLEQPQQDATADDHRFKRLDAHE